MTRTALLGLGWLAGISLIALLCACTRTPQAPQDEILVAATVAPHAWLAQQIAGDDAGVVTVLPVTADPHSHTPTDAEVTRLARCRILFRAGVPFENGSWLEALSSRGVKLVDLRRGLVLLHEGEKQPLRVDLLASA